MAALHVELEQRTAEAARLRGALGDARSELDARASTQSELETTLGELGVELRRLMAAVEEQRAELDEQRRAPTRSARNSSGGWANSTAGTRARAGQGRRPGSLSSPPRGTR